MNPDIVAAVAAHAAGEREINVSRLCRDQNISRNTFHVLSRRFQQEGAAAFTTRSTRPRRSPTRTSAGVADAIVRVRKELDDEGLDNGPISIGWRLEAESMTDVPSQSTIYRVLKDRGQIVAQPRKKPRGCRSFEFSAPNGCWQIDGLEHRLADNTVVCILQILDDHSRLDICDYAAKSENAADTWAAVERAFAGHGTPVHLLSDNGRAFSGKHRGGMAELERKLAGLGTVTIASSVARPQTCGKNERAHQTLRKWLRKQPLARTLTELQTQLDDYRSIYNNRRHQGIGGMTPQQRWDATHPAAPKPGPHVRAGRCRRPVTTTGVIQFDGLTITLGRKWATHTATVYWQGDRVTIMIGDTVARTLTLDRTTKYQTLSSKS